MARRSQAAIEYLILLGVTIIIVFIVVGYVVLYTHSEAKTASTTGESVISNVKSGILNITSQELNK
ncbi:hypothetical protein [Pyrococcus sp. ST04]|uniref:hypothetical protein n=1 Tax=Pyrococcus sp. ST04 TaxID=1183377 RepID=UPI00064F36E2|nr:hypothetical protein [Pyrococcus sp. ST04]